MSLFTQLIDLIYPPRCPICKTFLRDERVRINGKDLLLCRPCFRDFVPVESPRCPICGRPFRSGAGHDRVCEDCLRKRPFFDEARGPYHYQGPVMAALQQFKYNGKSHLAGVLGPLLAVFAADWLKDLPSPLIIPVPLHPKRLRERGFNQSLLLAKYVTEMLGADQDNLILRRTRYTRPQTGLKSAERRKNLRGAFGLVDKKAVRGRSVILVDDVATTGTTLNACARVLKRAGTKRVFGLVLAKTATGYRDVSRPPNPILQSSPTEG